MKTTQIFKGHRQLWLDGLGTVSVHFWLMLKCLSELKRILEFITSQVLPI